MGWTPLMVACRSGKTKIVQLFLENYDKEEIGWNDQDMDGNTLFMMACKRRSTGVVKFLLNNEEKSIDLDARDNNGYTPFMIACMKGYEEIVKLLLNHTIDFNAKVFQGYTNRTACNLAIKNERRNVVRLLLRYSTIKNIEMPKRIDKTSIHRFYPYPVSRTKRLQADRTYFNT